jgi:hypothetical protein
MPNMSDNFWIFLSLSCLLATGHFRYSSSFCHHPTINNQKGDRVDYNASIDLEAEQT